MRIAGAAEPDIELGVCFFRGELRHRFAGPFQRHRRLDACFLLELDACQVAPIGLHGADDVELVLRSGRTGNARDEPGGGRDEAR